MIELALRYGDGVKPVQLASGLKCETLAANLQPALPDPAGAVRSALRNPIGTPPLSEIVKPGERVAVLVNDITRLVHSEIFLPVLIDELNAAGIPDQDIFIVFALGIHRRQTPEEQRRVVGEQVARRIALYDHDCYDRENLVSLGRTSRGNEVWINRRVREAGRVILTGEIIYHLIAGYSGGRKGLVPGVAGATTTTFNHQFILDPRCRTGVLDGNPAHEDLLEACGMFGPDFLLNVVLTPTGQFAQVVAGHYEQAHRAGCKTVDQMYQVPFDKPYDMVLASAGGFPFDIDLRQAHKGLENAVRALRPGGVLIYFAECRDGAGHAAFAEWVEKFSSSAEMERELRSKFVVGGHKAYWVARLGERTRIHLVSALPESFVRRCHLHPTPDPQAVIERELSRLPSGARIACIPYAGFTFPAGSEASPSRQAADRRS
ncbi:MAG TPA: nickel-dependent lactate racemase [Terriglobia bacterium]|nr:nickel-dependent lactate racemase [Terriglobia bacterium]